jgi:putative ABC transport system permease protein
MSIPLLVWNYLKARPFNTLLNILLLSLGIAVITVLLLFNNQLQEKISDNAKGIDLVVAAKGSPLQIILCNIFQIDFPTGNIALLDAEKVASHRLVKTAIPLALGDSYKGYRIVGTNHKYAELYNAELSTGQLWNADLEVTLGATVGRLSGLRIDDTFVSAHGLTSEGGAHHENRYIVKGILKQTGDIIDNVILTNIRSIWRVHHLTDTAAAPILRPSGLVPGIEQGDSTKAITSLLIKYRHPLAIIQLPRFVNNFNNLQAAAPAFETARLFSILGAGVDLLRAFAGVLILISGLSIFIALYNSLKERQYDLAIMRAMGASRTTLFMTLFLEGISLTVAGGIAGIGLAHAVIWAFVLVVEKGARVGITPATFYSEEIVILGSSIFLGFLCSLIPALRAYRTDIHAVLAGN